mmetsp:Transcript_12715/g.27413  ORF Transcript_12715/g.27413 Transcript_12715/m.27413 type:complete len:1617 (+) Transcript_12715:83-4933(+)
MSISSGEFSQPLDDQHEEEKIRHRHHHSTEELAQDEKHYGIEGEGSLGKGVPPSTLLAQTDEDVEYAPDDNPPQAHAPPVGIRPGHHHYYPSSVQAPKPLYNSPGGVTDELEEHLKKKNPSFSSFFSSSESSSSPSPKNLGLMSPGPTIAASKSNDQKTTSNNHEDYPQIDQSHPRQQPVSAASLVVCGVDGTVYTLDAYTGQLRGMFASGPSLVFSSSPDEAAANKGDDGDDSNNNEMDENGDAAGSIHEDLNGDSTNALTSNVAPSWKERVVPGLDGKLYSLFEMVDTTEVEDNEGYDFDKCQSTVDEEYDDLDCDSSSGAGMGSGQGFSGSSLPRLGTYNLTPLPISAMDVVDSPISTCRPTKDGEPQQEQCGIIMGSKKTTIYAIDPTTGKVRWTQDPMGGGGGRGFTTRPPKSTASRGRGAAVLLQREDFAVRHLNTDGGEEVWKVELGRFSALDFDVDTSSRGGGGRNAGGQEASGDDDDLEQVDPIVGGRRRGAAAAAASVVSKDKKKGVPPILGGRKKTSFDFDSGFEGNRDYAGDSEESLFEHEDDFDHAHFRGFPSVAFGEDGTSIMAVDGISGELLWKRRIESVVVSVYGVGKESSWVPLDVIDESEIFTYGLSSASQNGQGVGLLQPSPYPTPSPQSGGLVPYGAGQLHRLGRHHSNLFVKPKFDPFGGYDLPLAEPEQDYLPYSAELHSPFPPQVADLRHEFQPTEDLLDVQPPPSRILESGLYLTWSMVTAIVIVLVTLIACVARVIILRQKRTLENTPSLDPKTTPISSENGRRRSQSSGGDLLVPAARTVTAPSSGNIWSKNDHPVVTRSFSLDGLGSNEVGSSSTDFARPTISEKVATTIPLPDVSAHALAKTSLGRGASTPSTPTAAVTAGSTLIPRSMTLPIEDDPDQQRPRAPSVDNIDGIPLVRYSRYRSEFEVISPLGSGGFGTVFRCENTLDGRHYALKKIKIISQLGMDGTVTKHFSQKLHRVLREVKILALLDHPNIVRYYTAWLETDDGMQSEDDETNTTSSMFDRKSNGFFSSSIFSGFASNSRATQISFSPKKNIHHPRSKGFNPLGWNNYGSFRLDESKSEASSYLGAEQVDDPLASNCEEDDDLGFNWDRSNEITADSSTNAEKRSGVKEESSQSSSGVSSVDSEESSDKSTKVSSFGVGQVDAPLAATCEEEDDLGFNWERSNEITVDDSQNNVERQSLRKLNQDTVKEENSQSSSGISSVDSEESIDKSMKALTKKSATHSNSDTKKTVTLIEPKKSEDATKTMEGKYVLFIQMQLCSVQTLADFLSNRQARHGSLSPSLLQDASYAVDIPYALRLFAQIANGVKYVHKQGLIHRDLKPQNCFIDDAGNVKVGDFGLSRESSTAGGITDFDENGEEENGHENSFPPPNGYNAENTAGVGTRAYASPEQMRGSNYDASTDVFSLGLLLFELCYPMYTSMERYKEFGGIRKGRFPTYWNSHVKTTFPTMHDLLVQMISDSALERPSADAVSDHVESLLREYSVQSLDKSWGKEGALFLRVEAEAREGILGHAMKLIKDAAPETKILQYGLRGQASRAFMETCSSPNLAIMEFAIETEDDEKNPSVKNISSCLHSHGMTVRQISNSL